MENHDYSQVYNAGSAPYETSIANKCGLATNYHAIAHPSLPNYIALTSGGTQGISDDSDPSSHPLNVNSIFNQIWLKSHVLARSYEETMPSHCYVTSSSEYAVRHNPWAYYINAQRNQCVQGDLQIPTGATADIASGPLYNDVTKGALRRFSFYTPNLCDDMHDCSVATGDAYLSKVVPFVISGPDYQHARLAIVITYDENSGQSGNHVYTAVISPFTAAGRKVSTNFTHYSLLRTAEEILGVPRLGKAASASDMRSPFGW